MLRAASKVSRHGRTDAILLACFVAHRARLHKKALTLGKSEAGVHELPQLQVRWARLMGPIALEERERRNDLKQSLRMHAEARG